MDFLQVYNGKNLYIGSYGLEDLKFSMSQKAWTLMT